MACGLKPSDGSKKNFLRVSLAYCILSHKNPGQVGRLLQTIWHPDNIYVLHYEKRASRAAHESIALVAARYPNVRVLRSRPIQWGRYSQLAAQLDALHACAEWSKDWSHFINLTGQDFPLLSQSMIMQDLTGRRGTSFVSSFDAFATGQWGDAKQRVTRVHFDSPALEALLRVPGIGRKVRAMFGWTNQLPFVPFVRRSQPASFRYYGGANHFILSAEAGAYLLHDPRAQKIIRWLRWTGFPEESSVQTALMNSHLAASVVNDDRRAIYWAKDGDPSPQTLRLVDLDRLGVARAEGKLFARKFDTSVDDNILKSLGEYLKR